MNINFWNEIMQLENAYDICRKKIMKRYKLLAIEVDVLLFLANNPKNDTATSLCSIRKMTKSHVSLAVSLLYEKGYLEKHVDPINKKLVHLIITKSAEEVVSFGKREQEAFLNVLVDNFTQEELEHLNNYRKRFSENLSRYEKMEQEGDKN